MSSREPIIFCICGPTASGKSSVCENITTRVTGIHFSISTTTRKPRPGEMNGREYHFVSEEQFLDKIAKDQFLEHAEYSGQRYGTEERNLKRAKEKNMDLLLEIEVNGAKQIKERYGAGVVTVFIYPPSFSELEGRLRKRATDSEEQIIKRLEIAKSEIQTLSSPGFSNYLVVNDHLDEALKSVQSIIEAERCSFDRQSKGYLDALLGAA